MKDLPALPRKTFHSPRVLSFFSDSLWSQTFSCSKRSWLPRFLITALHPVSPVSFVAQVLIPYPGSWPCQSSGSRRPLPGALGLAPTRAQGHTNDMGMSIPQYLGQMDIRKGVVGLATGAGFIYLLYKAIRAGIKCQPPLCTASPICIARECTGPGERALPQEAPAPEASSVGGPKGDSFKFLCPSFLFSICLKPAVEMLA